jgi:hypothetical protein
VEFKVPSWQRSILLGSEGNTVSSLQKRANVKVFFSASQKKKRVIDEGFRLTSLKMEEKKKLSKFMAQQLDFKKRFHIISVWSQDVMNNEQRERWKDAKKR